MNRRGFCKSLAMVPAAVVAINVGVPAADRSRVLIHTGNNVKLQFPKLYPKYGTALCEHPYSVSIRTLLRQCRAMNRSFERAHLIKENSNETG